MARASNQFTEGEALLLAEIFTGLMQGRVDPSWASNPSFAGLVRKIQTLKSSAANPRKRVPKK